MVEIIGSLSRIGDRSPKTIEGAALTVRMLEQRLDAKARVIIGGRLPSRPEWRASLSAAGEALVELADAVESAIESDALVAVVAGTCSASLATLPVVARRHPNATVLWIDAHGDFNTPTTTGSGYLGGMVLSAACGLWNSGHGAALDPTRLILLGARDIDPSEGELLRRHSVRVIAPAAASPDAIRAAVGDTPLWIHLDYDALEPGFVPADYSVPGGLHPDSISDIFRALRGCRLLGVEVAEFVPSDDAEENAAALKTIWHILAPLLDRGN